MKRKLPKPPSIYIFSEALVTIAHLLFLFLPALKQLCHWLDLFKPLQTGILFAAHILERRSNSLKQWLLMLFGVNTKLDFFTFLKLLLPFPFIHLSPWGLPALLPGLLPLLSSYDDVSPHHHLNSTTSIKLPLLTMLQKLLAEHHTDFSGSSERVITYQIGPSLRTSDDSVSLTFPWPP